MKQFPLIGLVALAACVEEPIDGQRAFAQDCAGCHGASGMGDGPLAAGLVPPPPDLTQLSARNGGIYPADYVMSTIDGLNRTPHFSAAMPEFGAGDLGETVIVERDGLGTPIPIRLLAISDYLEALQR